MNQKLITIPIVIGIIIVGVYVGITPSENIQSSQIEQRTEFMESPTLIQTNVKSLFKVLFVLPLLYNPKLVYPVYCEVSPLS